MVNLFKIRPKHFLRDESILIFLTFSKNNEGKRFVHLPCKTGLDKLNRFQILFLSSIIDRIL